MMASSSATTTRVGNAALRSPVLRRVRHRPGSGRQGGTSARLRRQSRHAARPSGAADGAHLSYLATLRDWDRQFPGFENEVHGLWEEDGVAKVYCVREESG